MTVHEVTEDRTGVPALPRPDWRDSLSLAADLVLVGIVLVFGALTVVGAGGVLVTASVAVNRAVLHRSFPTAGDLWATLRASFARGFAAVLLAALAGALVGLDVAALRAGTVPGGTAAVVVVAVVALAGIAVAAVALVRLGQTEGRGFRAALRFALRLLGSRPGSGLGLLATLAVAGVLCWIMPILVVFLPGIVLFALHVVVRRAMH